MVPLPLRFQEESPDRIKVPKAALRSSGEEELQQCSELNNHTKLLLRMPVVTPKTPTKSKSTIDGTTISRNPFTK